ncbi:bifunctional methylenetetrahydrofolate dehydrogenase/methenyltetrahydrofolate cyclohydrolase FolD [Helicobacter kayseriensis]|uniref:bifunctional methylenetetrahydrofolate dehydrogenase/methenyltetrahydrofolate cyclohydrolase FolD n=1 Tax=Helicobacter kayseriensis TaxID=2905877 RepID=UPI001E2C02C3|nr:bifunctional methylenetetrahydrofolate dehydrogenase/methenyltetrahydrofolate cyclohydrolase FolD [Helicobacter kayseriensis]MCE3048207.1 bifunctional methylenetetrahydrofolate dehydrogenase/methenyltetrahydrofolate cyclohydrolase FolD [Helicobacter kayseriensis]
MKLLDGKTLGSTIEEQIKQEIRELNQNFIYPTLAVILVGNDAPSASYVKMKSKACERVGINSLIFGMPENTSEEFLLQKIEELNKDLKVHGILVQLPLPQHINTQKILETIDPQKDVDGFHPLNMGKLMVGLDGFIPATPLGVMQLLEAYHLSVRGKNCVVIGASNIVGKPLASLLLNAGATVSVCHILTKDVSLFTKEADFVFVAVGKIGLLTAEMIKEGAVIVDIGINRTNEGAIVGDVEFDFVAPKCSFITPVPGGVGPMTIATLLQNTLKSARNFAKDMK